MSDRIPPHDISAEQALLGACLLSPDVISEALAIVLATDFYKPVHQHVWDAISSLWRRGDPVDAVTVAGLLVDTGALDDPTGLLLDLQSTTPAISRSKVYAERVVRSSRLRAALGAASEILDAVYDGKDPEDVHTLITELAMDDRLLPREIKLPDTLSHASDFLLWYADQHPDEGGEWIVPGSLKARWRVLIVAPEGSAKTTVCRQFAHAVANGQQPFVGGSIRPRRVLHIDCENPPDAIVDQIRLIDKCVGAEWSQSENLWLWRHEAGFDLRAKRADQARFQQVIQEVRPELVILGPVYKIYSNTDNLEQSALELFRFLDDLRARFGFALVLEHHAPKGNSSVRDLVPFGTVAWQRWPEFGIRFKPEKFDDHRHPHVLHVERFRGDRVVATWPKRLDRDSIADQRPWVGTYADGTWSSQPNEEQDPPPPPTDDDW